jgi:eukaryotic-like serine/threonine-protein kinase
LELRHLRYFVAVAEERHVGRAAGRLNVSQPSLSAQIHDLERELGALLFERTPRGMTLTPAGEKFLAHARRTLREADHAVGAVREAERATTDYSELRDALQTALGTAYTMEGQLGGADSRVFVATENSLARRVVVKALPRALAAGVSADRFRQEVQFAARLTHPHIVPALTAGGAAALLYYTMPFVEGESLRARLARERQLPLDDALGIAREVADALTYAHGQSVIHRDITPDNILLAAGHALVTNFGIARAVTRAGETGLTAPGVILGTPAYMSPEQAKGAPEVDARSDIYSLAAVLFEMLAGEPPFTGATAQAIIAKQQSTAAPQLRSRRPSVPETVDRAVAQGLATNPADRFQTVRAFAAALSAAPR